MDANEPSIQCAINLQWSNSQGTTGRKLAHRVATLKLLRNNLTEMFIEISTEKTKPVKLKLKGVTVHKKFMNEGKASINFPIEKCILFISNAPPASLMNFLRIIFIKLSGNENENDKIKEKNLRSHMLSRNPSAFQEVSPVTNQEMVAARKKAMITSRASDNISTTPLKPHPQPTKRRRIEQEAQSSNDSIEKSIDPKRPYQPFSPGVSFEEDIKLCDEQNSVLEACLSGKNIFFTGSAGTGKSFLLKKIISTLPPEDTIATASTGVAASLIGGVTIHSFAGIGGGDMGLMRCLEMASRPVNAQNWRKCKRLIVDEISMVDGTYFEKIEAVARHVRKNDKPFGGIQLILCGDFFQLPPVNRREFNSQESNKKFCFQTETWEKCIQMVFELKQVHRQSDPEFVKILNYVRIGYVPDEVNSRLLLTSSQRIESNGILATQLCARNNDADMINNSKLERLSGEEFVFKAEDSDANQTKQLDNMLQVPSTLVLKEGAQVMLLKNLNVASGLVNGARGIVKRIEKGVPTILFKNNIEYVCKPEKWIVKMASGAVIIRKQIPLKLAWAFSIHKSQGLTLDCVEMSLSKIFEAGQAYVALSRAKSLDSIRILDFDRKQVWANPQVLQYYKTFRRRLHDMTMIPLGAKNVSKKGKEQLKSLAKIKKSLIDKPLVTIC